MKIIKKYYYNVFLHLMSHNGLFIEFKLAFYMNQKLVITYTYLYI